jgi:outer membrane receptor for ferric coprogen and ferric-rhodotorulic acid
MRCQSPRLAPLALAAALVLGASAARAQSPEAPRAPISIHAQPLAQALNDWARQTRIQLIVQQALVAGRTAPEVAGDLTPMQALDRLLAGTGLVGSVEGDAVVIKPAPPRGPAAMLAPVTVSANADEGTTEGSGSYTVGATTAATGLNLSLRDTPQSVSVITQDRIEDQAMVTVADALRSTPGVSFQPWDRGRNRISVRGFDITSFQYDGVPVENINIGAETNNTALYDRVEVVRGATGLLSGAGDPSASINLVRKHADSKTFTGSAEVEAGSWNHRAATST